MLDNTLWDRSYFNANIEEIMPPTFVLYDWKHENIYASLSFRIIWRNTLSTNIIIQAPALMQACGCCTRADT